MTIHCQLVHVIPIILECRIPRNKRLKNVFILIQNEPCSKNSWFKNIEVIINLQTYFKW